MWTMAVVIYACSKWLTWWTTSISNVPVWRHAAYLLAWPGLDAPSFLGERPIAVTSRCRSREYFSSVAKLTFGMAALFGVARLIPDRNAYVIGWIGMIGLVLILHFGIFHLLSCWWRHIGVQARPLMNQPLTSTSLSEFWGKRWNTAFRDLTYRFLFRPCAGWFGMRWGIVAGFLFSGAIHDLVISVPAHGGYGGPTIYFGVQGTAMVLERTAFGRRLGLGAGWPGRLFAAAVLLVPAGLLFHRPFVVGIIVPFMRFLGAI
jgi:hypothetical protein